MSVSSNVMEVGIPLRESDGDGEHSIEAKERELHGYLDIGGVAIAALVDGRLAGIGVVVPHLRPRVAQLAFLHVSAPWRGTGIGSRLAAQLDDIALSAGDTEMVVSATPSKITVDFYLGRGFLVTAHPLSALLELEPDDVHMHKMLWAAGRRLLDPEEHDSSSAFLLRPLTPATLRPNPAPRHRFSDRPFRAAGPPP